MNSEKNLTNNIYSSFRFISSFITVLFTMTALHAGSQATETPAKANQNTIAQYEQSGDYATALKIARDIYKESLQLGLSQETTNLSQTVKCLEEKLLSLGFSRLLFNENYQPRVKLLQLLELIGMESVEKKAIVQINHWAQKNLLRQGERWEQTNRFENLRPKITPLLRELGFIDATLPHFKEYQGAIVHGALLSRVRLRVYYLVKQWQQGTRFSHLYFLSGERPLEPNLENKNFLTKDSESLLKIRKDWLEPVVFPETECEMIQLVWEQSEIPKDMRKQVKVHFINAPMKKDAKNERLLRPTTDDTIKAWLKTTPIQGNYLVITNAPYTNRQDLVMRSLTPREYGFDTIGSAASKQENASVFLDELARCIFQATQLSEN